MKKLRVVVLSLMAAAASACASSPGSIPGLQPERLGRLSYRMGFGAAPDGWTGDGVRISAGSLRLAEGAADGVFESPEYAVPGFDWLVPSWDTICTGGATVGVAFQVRVKGAWSDWLSFGLWGDAPASGEKPSDAYGRIEIDTLLLYAPADALRIRLTLSTNGAPAGPEVRSVSWVARDRFATPLAEPSPQDYPESSISVPERSQMVEDPAIAGKICSPTSLAMVLESLGTNLPTAELAWMVYDARAGIFGNWSFNAARASSLGHAARVDYLDGIGELAAELRKGRPVVASVQYEKGALTGAAVDSTAGHLLVVRGIARRGDDWYVLVNDPAAPDAPAAAREYLARQFKYAWTGVVYLFE